MNVEIVTGIARDLRDQTEIGNWTKMILMRGGNEKEDRKNEVRLMLR